MATRAEKNFEKALLELASEDVSTALSVLTGCFVSLTLEVLRRTGHVPDGDIKINGGDQRQGTTATIHPRGTLNVNTPNTASVAATFDTWIKREYPHLGPIGDGVVIAREAWSAALASAPQPSTESVLIDGTAYDVPAPVAAEMLRLHIELRQAAPQQPSEAEHVCAEAYQVAGCLLSDAGLFETEQARKLLDNLSQARMVHKDVLPWSSVEVTKQPVDELQGWEEAAIAWEVCASVHRQWARGKDALFKTRQEEFIRHAEGARQTVLSAPQAAAAMRDAYEGAREDSVIWKKRALEAERDLRSERESTSRLAAEINADNGPAHMGEPAQAAQAVPRGWKLAPVAPTQAQLSAGNAVSVAWGDIAESQAFSFDELQSIYQAMLAAAPSAPADHSEQALNMVRAGAPAAQQEGGS